MPVVSPPYGGGIPPCFPPEFPGFRFRQMAVIIDWRFLRRQAMHGFFTRKIPEPSRFGLPFIVPFLGPGARCPEKTGTGVTRGRRDGFRQRSRRHAGPSSAGAVLVRFLQEKRGWADSSGPVHRLFPRVGRALRRGLFLFLSGICLWPLPAGRRRVWKKSVPETGRNGRPCRIAVARRGSAGASGRHPACRAGAVFG